MEMTAAAGKVKKRDWQRSESWPTLASFRHAILMRTDCPLITSLHRHYAGLEVGIAADHRNQLGRL